MVENKENLTNETIEATAGDSFEDIADYYKNMDSHEEENVEIPKRTIISDPDAYANEGYTPAFTRHRYSGNLIADIAFIAAVLVVAMAVLMFSFQLGSMGMKSEALVESKYLELLQSSSKYNDLIKQISSINVEIEDYSHERDLKQSEYDALIAYRDNEGAVTDEIAALQSRLDTLNIENAKKQAEIDSLTTDISEKISAIMNLPPGIYTVGENIAAGKYTITGSGSILVSSSKGSVKLNTILTADGVSITLDDMDKIQLDTRAKFSPAN